MAQANIKAVITAEDRASSVVQGFGGSIKGMASAVAIGTLAVQGVTLAIQKFGEAAKFAVDSASDFQQSRIAFETMLGSAAGAKKMLRDVSDFAQKTPFELPEVVTGAKQLLAYNVEADKIIPTFKALGNIAAGVGKDKLPQLILAFGQVKAATKLTGMELRQFSEAGVPMLSTLAKQMGKSEAAIQEMVSEGQIGFPEVEKALFGMSQEGGKFFNLMDKQSKTFGGIMSNLSDNFGRLARNIIGISDDGEVRKGSIFFYMQKGAEGFLSWIDQNKQGILNGVNGIVNAFIALGPSVKAVFGFLGDKATIAMNGLKIAFETLKPAIMELWTAISTNLWPAIQNLYTAIEPLLPILGTVLVGAIYIIIKSMTLWYNILSVIFNAFAGLVNFIKGDAVTGMTGAFQWIQDKFTYLKDHFFSIIGMIVGFFATLPFKLPLYVVAAIVAIVKYLASINWTNVFASIGRAHMDVWNNIKSKVSEVWNWMKNIDWGGVVRNVFNGINTAIIRMIEGAINGALAGIPGAPRIKLNYKKFANGVENFEGGMAMVGERGPELVSLPKGSSVKNATETSKMGGTTNIYISPNIGVYTGSNQEMRRLSQEIVTALKDVANSRNITVQELMGA